MTASQIQSSDKVGAPNSTRARAVSCRSDFVQPQPVAEFEGERRAAGNLAIQRLFRSGIIQAKLAIGRPDDVYEREADDVANLIVRPASNPMI